jgi:putative membrane protein
MTALLAVSAWEYELHPEVWLLIAAVAAFGVYSVRSIGPLAVTDGTPIITAPQKRYFLAGVLLLWLAADWPMHDIAEKHLYSVHMIQHLLISFIVPPLLLLAMPAWLARLLILDDGLAQRLLQPLTKPIVAGLLFNMFQILTHWGAVVNLSVENGVFHYALHLGVFFSALLMWFPILGPLKEMQMSEPGKMIYLFLMSVVPTVPAGWLTFAEGVVYSSYDHSDPLWGISPTHDQQVAGVVMKIIGGFYLWSLIALRFMRFAGGQREADMAARQNRSSLTHAEVKNEVVDADDHPVGGPDS